MRASHVWGVTALLCLLWPAAAAALALILSSPPALAQFPDEIWLAPGDGSLIFRVPLGPVYDPGPPLPPPFPLEPGGIVAPEPDATVAPEPSDEPLRVVAQRPRPHFYPQSEMDVISARCPAGAKAMRRARARHDHVAELLIFAAILDGNCAE